MKLPGHRVAVVLSYAAAALALAIGLSGKGAVWSAVTANVLLVIMVICAVTAVALAWRPSRKRALAPKLLFTLVSLLPAAFFLLVILAIAFMR